MTSPQLKSYSEQVAQRIRLERERLGLTQAAFAEMAGVGRASQIFYENNDRYPDTAYFEKLTKHDIDVPYLLIGQRSQSTYNDADWLHFKSEVLWEVFTASLKIGQPTLPTQSAEASLAAFKAFCAVYSERNDEGALAELRERALRLQRCA